MMSNERHTTRLLIQLLCFLVLAVTSAVHADTKADGSKSEDADFHGGKSFQEWITQAKQGRKLQDRHDALQVLRNVGLNHDRNRTLRVFTEALSDKLPSVRSLAAVGLLKAGNPTDPKAPLELVKILSKDLFGAKPRVYLPGRVNDKFIEVDFPIREIRALGEIGGEAHVPALRRIAENKKVHVLLRQFADRAIRQIKDRASKVPKDPPSR